MTYITLEEFFEQHPDMTEDEMYEPVGDDLAKVLNEKVGHIWTVFEDDKKEETLVLNGVRLSGVKGFFLTVPEEEDENDESVANNSDGS